MKNRHLLLSASIVAFVASVSFVAQAQTEITDDQTINILTSTGGDVNVTNTGTITITSGAAVTIDSDNTVTNAGTITSLDVNDTTGILVSGDRTGTIANNNVIRLTETQPTENLTPGGDIASGSGRIGILISGGSNFTGNIENGSASSITIQGQDSAGIRLAQTASMTGDLIQAGSISVFGERSTAIDIAGNVIGNLAISGAVRTAGEDSSAINVSGDVSGGLSITSSVQSTAITTNTRQTVLTRPTLAARDLLDSEGSVRQSGSVVNISGNIGGGVLFGERRDPTTDALLSVASVILAGSAPAILIDGQGTPIAIGLVGQITDPNAEGFDADLQFAFVNQGNLVADAILNDIDATTFKLADASLNGGFNNTLTMLSSVYRSGIDPTATTPTHDAHARVIVIGNAGLAERINNSGTISARGFEAADEIFVDRTNLQNPNQIFATAIEIDAGGSLGEITNSGIISAVITGRRGQVIAIKDNSGTLMTINNTGTIAALASTSDPLNEETITFTNIAIDVSANTAGFTLNQTAPASDAAAINGDILLGSGDDNILVSNGTITGDIAFGNGADRLEISNGSTVTGSLIDSDGQLEILVSGNSALAITSGQDIFVTNASFDGTSTYSPFVDTQTGDTSLLIASGDVTFADGAKITPVLANILNANTTVFTLITADTLTIEAPLSSLRGEAAPFLFDTTFSISPTDPNTLLLTLDLRDQNQLGLDPQQAGAFTSAFEALTNSTPLGAAFVGLTDQTSFNAAYNQLLPEFAAAARQFVLANVDGATGAVGSHLQNARRATERPGGAWIEEFGYFADRELAGLSEQYRGYGFGITGGFDTDFGPFHAVGINFGFASTEIEDVVGVDEPLDILTIQGGLYAGYELGDLGIQMYAGGGYNDFSSTRNVRIGNFDESTNSDWKGTHYNGSISAGYDINFGKYYIRPTATVTYLSLREDAHTETGAQSIALDIDKRSVETGTASAVLEFGAKYAKERSWFSPSLRVGIKNDFINDGVVTTGQFVNGSTPFSILSEEFPDTGILLGVTFASGSAYSSFSFDLDTDYRDGFIRHTARVVLRLLF
jgi:uncharacterized protein with beta-barrel porin domain